MRSTDDLIRVPRRDFRFLRDEELVRLLVLHRRQGDHARAKEAWDQLVENLYDRVRTWVVTWRWTGHGVQVPPAEYDDVTQLAIIRIGGAMENFQGDVLPQFRAFAFTCTKNACMDWARKEMKREMGIAGSIQDTVPGEEEDFGRFDAELARVAERLAARDEERLEAEEAIARALPHIANADQRAVLELTLDGMPADEIRAQLGISTMDNLYQLRRRGMTQLKEVLGDGLG